MYLVGILDLQAVAGAAAAQDLREKRCEALQGRSLRGLAAASIY
jgi:hypothetical protein